MASDVDLRTRLVGDGFRRERGGPPRLPYLAAEVGLAVPQTRLAAAGPMRWAPMFMGAMRCRAQDIIRPSE